MIKIKLTQNGGYVIGDGPCPFDPDDFLKAFSHKMVEMRARGMVEMGIPQEEVDAFIAGINHGIDEEIDRAPMIEIAQSRKATPEQVKQRIFGAIDTVQQQLAIQQVDPPLILEDRRD